MAYDFFGLGNSESSNIIQVEGAKVELPDASYIRDAALVRDGADLILDGPQGTITVEGYFSASDAPELVAPGGLTLTPELVNSFAKSPAQYANASTANDVSPVGAVDETSGEATITRADGSVEPITIGTAIYQGDVIETSADGAVNIAFIDETSFAVSEEARLAIDEYVYDPATESGSQNFSVLKGVFVFTSGLIGRDDPDDVNIDTPSGSIGIRGTIIAGNADTGEVTVIEGAIVVRDNGGNEMTLASQFETAKFNPVEGVIENLGQLLPQEVSKRFVNVSNVSPTLFSSINDAMDELGVVDANPSVQGDKPDEGPDSPEGPREQFDADGTVDHDGDHEVDGTVDEGGEAAGEAAGDAASDGAPKAEDGTAPGEEAPDAPGEDPAMPKQSNMQPNMMGTDPMGMNSAGMGDPMGMGSGGMGMGGNMAAGMGADPMGMGPGGMNDPMGDDTGPDGNDPFADGPPDPTQDPNTIVPPTGGGGGALPIINVAGDPKFSTAPLEYFSTSSGQTWEYHFDLEFVSPGGPGVIQGFQLLGGTISALNANFAGGQASSATLSDGDWFFDSNNGQLKAQSGSIASDSSFSIDIVALNSAGPAASGSYMFYLESPDGTLGTVLTNEDATFETYTDLANGPGTTNIGSGNVTSNKSIFAGGGNDTVNIVQGNNNIVNLGSGQNDFMVFAGHTDNIAIGGLQKDTFTLDDVRNDVFGMDGDDKIKIDLAVGSGVTTKDVLESNSWLGTLDGGHSSFNAAQHLLGLGFGYQGFVDNGGFGDTLILEGNANLDFRVIDDEYIRGIERIDLNATGTSGDVDIDLTYADIMEMTDHKNTLIIRGDINDSVTFHGMSGLLTPRANDYNAYDDNYDGLSAASSFDVYSDGTVTILIEQDGAGNNALGVTGL